MRGLFVYFLVDVAARRNGAGTMLALISTAVLLIVGGPLLKKVWESVESQH